MPGEQPRNNSEHRSKRDLPSRAARAIIKSAFFISTMRYHGPIVAHRLVTDRERHIGLLEGSILAPRLAFPDADGVFTYKHGRSAELRWFDPLRITTFPRSRRGKGVYAGEGSPWMFYPEEIVDNTADTQTPLWLLDPFTVEHYLTMDKCSQEEMLGRQVVRATTMAEAYERVGMPDFAEELDQRNLANEPVLQVTPKGNTLIVPQKASGNPEPKRESEKAPVLLPGRLAGA